MFIQKYEKSQNRDRALACFREPCFSEALVLVESLSVSWWLTQNSKRRRKGFQIFYTDHHCFCKISSILRRISQSFRSSLCSLVLSLKNWNRPQLRVKSPSTWWKPTGVSVSFITFKGILCMRTLFCDSGPNSCCAFHQMSIGISLFVYVQRIIGFGFSVLTSKFCYSNTNRQNISSISRKQQIFTFLWCPLLMWKHICIKSFIICWVD